MEWEKMMEKRLDFAKGGYVTISTPARTVKRIEKLHFQNCKPVASNFSLWRHVDDLLNDAEVAERLAEKIEERWKKGELGAATSTITCETIIGWAGTAPRSDYSSVMLEKFFPNGRSEGMRIRPHITDPKHCAPRTRDITFVYSMWSHGRAPLVVLYQIYPGPNIGELRGNVTKREGVVFFDPSHPGVPA